MRSLALFVAISLSLLPACSADDGGSALAEPDTSGSASIDPGTSPTVDADRPAPTAPDATPTPASSFYGDFDTVITQATAESGGGIRPLLAWDAVEGADHYGVYLYAPSGATYWAWRGAESSVYVGGAESIREDAAGPSIAAGMAWAVVAYDAELLPIAASPMRPIAP